MKSILDLIFSNTVFGFGASLIFGAGCILVSDEFKKFSAAKVCFYFAAAWICGRVIMWSVSTTEVTYVRLLATFLAFGIVGVVLAEGVRATNLREKQVTNEGREASQQQPGPLKTDTKQETHGDNSPNISGDHNTINYNLKDPKVAAKLDEITKLLKEQGSRLREEELLKKYPLGYVIFDVDRSNQVFPYQAKTILDKYDIDWAGVRVEENPPGRIILHLPGLKTKDGTTAITGVSTGGPKQIGNLGGGGVNDLLEWGEILAIGKDGIVFLVGFQQNPIVPR